MNIKRSVFAVLLIVVMVALSACTPAGTSSTNTERLSEMYITGRGEVLLTPDIAYIYIGVRSQAENVSDALRDNTAQAQAVAQVLTGMGVESSDIQTSAFNVYPMEQYSPEGQPTGTTYVVENSVFVTVRDLSRLGEMLDAVVGAGANTINSITFDVADKTAALSEARQKAVENAKSQAEELAAAADVELVRIVNLSAYSSTPMATMAYGGGKGLDVAASVPVSSGQLSLVVEVSVTYEIK